MPLALADRQAVMERLVKARCDGGRHGEGLNLALNFYARVGEETPSPEQLDRLCSTIRTCLEGLRLRPDQRDLPLPNAVELLLVLGALASAASTYALVFIQIGKYQEALPHAQHAYALARQFIGPENPAFGGYLENLITIHQFFRNEAALEPLYREQAGLGPGLLQLATAADFGQALSMQALSLKRGGRYAEAENLYKNALEEVRATHGERSAQAAQVSNNLGRLYEEMGRQTEAEALLRTALEIRESLFGANHPEVIASLRNLAGHQRSLGRLAVALQFLQDALARNRAMHGERHAQVAFCLHDLGVVSQEAGDTAAATAFLTEALQIRRELLGDGHVDTANTMAHLATLTVTTDQRASLRQALEILRKTFGDGDPQVALGMERLALEYVRQGPVQEALPLLEQALDIRRRTLGEDHEATARSFNGLGLAHHRMADYPAAEQYYRRSLQILEHSKDDRSSSLADGRCNLAAVCAAQGRAGEAIELLDAAIATYDEALGSFFGSAAEQQRMRYLARFRQDYDSWLTLALRSPGMDVAARMMDFVLRHKALAAEALAVQRNTVSGERDPEIGRAMAELAALRWRVARARLARDARTPGEHGEDIAQCEARRIDLEIDLARAIPAMNLTRRLRSVDRKAVAERLPSGGALIEVVQFNEVEFGSAAADSRVEPRYVALIMRAGRCDAVASVDLGSAREIDRSVALFRQSITRESEAGASALHDPVGDPGEALHALLVLPLLPHLDGCRRLLISPDGNLSRLPFEVLPTPDGRRLVDDYEITYLGAGRDLVTGADAVAATTHPVVIADPDFDLHTGSVATAAAGAPRVARGLAGVRFSPLAGTLVEGAMIADLLAVRPWLKGEALEGRLKALRSPRILHIASHGFFLPAKAFDNREFIQVLLAAEIGNPELRALLPR
jgi:tetratricopeptide (TPR) repeat protein